MTSNRILSTTRPIAYPSMMGELPPLQVQQPPPPNADDPVRTRQRSSGRIGVLQFNVGSLSANIHEVRSVLKQLRPAVVLIQETSLTEGSVVPSDLKARKASPRQQQSLHSQYRCDRVVSAGVYPRKLKYINNPSCRFCGYPRETISHLLDDCAGTRAYCSQHDLSTQTLVKESPSSSCSKWLNLTIGFGRLCIMTQSLPVTEFDNLSAL